MTRNGGILIFTLQVKFREIKKVARVTSGSGNMRVNLSLCGSKLCAVSAPQIPTQRNVQWACTRAAGTYPAVNNELFPFSWWHSVL